MKRRFLSIILSLCMIFSMFSYTTFAISNNLNDLGSKYLLKSEPEETDIRTESLTEVSFTRSNKIWFFVNSGGVKTPLLLLNTQVYQFSKSFIIS